MENASPGWPGSADELAAVQLELAGRRPPLWRPEPWRTPVLGGCFCSFPRGIQGPGSAGDQVWVAAVSLTPGGRTASAVVRRGEAGAEYVPGRLALREGALLEQAVRALEVWPEVLLVNATGRDHPRRAGLALQLGAVLDLPTVGVTHRPLLATGSWPPDRAGAASPLVLEDAVVGAWVRTKPGTRPLVAHAAWRTDPDVAVDVVRLASGDYRTPIPLREARRLARRART